MPMKNAKSNDFLSAAAMDYYNRYGKNRGIDKFFRKTHRASSDSSLIDKNESQNIECDFAKSLNNLKISEIECKSHETSMRSEEAVESSSSEEETSYAKMVEKKVNFDDRQQEEKSVVVKASSVKESSTMTDTQSVPLPQDKPLNLNLQSKIEITLPPQFQQQQTEVSPPVVTKEAQPMPLLPPQVPPFYPPQKILYCAETQTTEVPDEPLIKPTVNLNTSSNKPDDLESSPNESVTSREQRLEWDSLGDVGYHPFLICDKSALSSTERKALKSYLSKRGLTSSENIIVFKNSPGKQDESPKSRKRPERKRSLTYGDNWLEVYTKYKDKYSIDALKTAVKPFKPEAQSTPFVDEASLRFVEKSAQTSLINLLCKSIQVETGSQTKDCSSESSEIVLPESLAKEDVNQTDFSMETSSVVFINGSPKKNKGSTKDASPKRQVEKKQSPKRKKSLISVFESTVQTTKSHTDTSQKSSSTDESTFKDKGTTTFDEELKMAMQLMNSVVESKTMHNDMKKSLINKLMQRIVGLKITSQEQIEEKIPSNQESTTSKSSSASTIPCDTSASTAKDTSDGSLSSKKAASTVKSQPISDKDSDIDTISKRTYTREPFGDVVKQTLKPMTHSEVDYENHKANTNTSSGKYGSKESSTTSSVSEKDSMSKKVGQLLSIEKEIERLIKMKELVQFDLKKRKDSADKIYENIDNLRPGSSNGTHKSTRKNERSRLCTPETLERNLTNDLLHRKEKFVELYENQRGKLYEIPGVSEVIYTKPYGTKGSSHSEGKETEKYRNQSRQGTSMASSEIISSRSVSLPMGGNTVTNTSTHQYDIERLPNQYALGVETQTTDSLKRALPFFENKPRIIKNAQRTQIVDKTRLNKQIQTTCPQPLAYTIVFDGNGKKCNEKQPKEKEIDEEFIDTRTLNEHLTDKRPHTRQTMDRRNECIKELRRLRQLRNEQRKKLLLLTSETSLKEKIRNLPPPPLAQKRLFSTRALKLHSLKQYQNLPEVQRKKEVEMVNNLKKKNRFLLDLFNKNLQRKVLKGQTDVSYSVNLFTNG